MVNKRKLLMLIAATVVGCALVVAAIVIAVSHSGSDAPAPTGSERTSSPAPSVPGSGGDTPVPDADAESWEAFSDYEQMTRDVAAAACKWRKPTNEEVTRKHYEQYGMSAELAASFQPLWAEVFAAENVASAEIWCKTVAPVGLNKVTGEDGSWVWRVGVPLSYQGTWHQDGSPHFQPPASATWYLTVDQAAGTVTAIDQPDLEDMQIRINEED